MPPPRPIRIFWAAVLADIIAVSALWSAARSAGSGSTAAMIASIVVIGAATAIATRILVVLTRGTRRPGPTAPTPARPIKTDIQA